MRLLAWVVRVAGCLILAAATALAVGDIARSLASGATTLMPLETAARMAGLTVFDAASNAVAASGVFASEGRGASLATEIGRQPASIVLGLAGVILLAVGRPPRRVTRTQR
ncbi:hypothetical protein [Aureimonas phyllosphaerae]|uniref:Mannose/fructose/N-acetylgalactosamine-specific phosphotransferase system component IIC n=1 Tax=Aureimonas phyllosphaerae TaxID=1166078 RepID=A0A7W6BPW2_9HYPH|nr:hypothetical protein [Aureimonas phyllosphaerae]MBB3935899.1 mannose/fructose/N-acetylgalactosamine-specific phosphotransferase system component IIC [Aureimonas phyllosphaerae]MBB3959907.1 mannose/fructose/N-acetylgalactosamine-specific phosphotransferase system component IIC [Aureimonas phyllosphaerae]SFF56905.1 hypothetical protein SAMN05216566_13113 [Aureimonas phyllosphaerae]